MIKIALCDDNELQNDLLTEIIEDYARERKLKISIDKFISAELLIEAVVENGFYSLYVLDMILPGINGIELAAVLRRMKDRGKIIFLTSSVEYAVDSYDVGAYYYMLKPIEIDKIKRVLDGAVKEILSLARREVSVKSHSCDYTVAIEDIAYVDIYGRCPVYHMRDGRRIQGNTIRGSFKECVSQIIECEEFFLCGPGILINTKYVDVIDAESVGLKDGVKLYPSKSGILGLKRYIKSKQSI